MGRRLINKIEDVIQDVQGEIARDLVGHEDNMYARGQSTEGWQGGYQQALRDVIAYINGYTNINSRHNKHWKGKARRRIR
ncbi:hypothetical protein SmaMPs15_000063 [Stenotrophomonas maltophilia phage vB_SmaM_Ps15]|uniref:Uncharacterized protein n=1 Tax=Stenotrophomonas maltophilia phage vB_SmaM_Ps15 TaxID=3071007 RepID=A0AAE9FLH6_9CAUD|nr:hypothetical protein PQC01_gp063 [Stenotrophomonas maltophilia phage vB_SmaM_Ps15]UMO77214.1 hypothetical protein SmaMPs15_000063 [Stenotrophomonas maltophilia phage vB_SmaM_Ps15]